MSKLIDLGAALISLSVIWLTFFAFVGWLWSTLLGAFA